jgi:hypothetical protein
MILPQVFRQVFVPVGAVLHHGCNTHQGGDFLPVEFAKFRQLAHERIGHYLPYAFGAHGQIPLFSSLRDCIN